MNRLHTSEPTDTTIGIVGADGDLGRSLVRMATERNFSVLRTDRRRIVGGVSLDELMDRSDFVHFSIAEADFDQGYALRPNQIGILHDSVMATSKRIDSEHFEGNADVVHMLMNKSRTVVVEQNNTHADVVGTHMEALGLNVKKMSAEEHDRIMARSQAPLAILVKLLLPDLEQRHEEELLTASGDALLKALQARASKWTDPTMKAILSNPQLPDFIEDMTRFIADGGEVR
jgi:hypothetical protein